jgi:hypothetical protein
MGCLAALCRPDRRSAFIRKYRQIAAIEVINRDGSAALVVKGR